MTLPTEGYVRRSTLVGNRKRSISGILPITSQCLDQWIVQGRWPAPIRLAPGTVVWRVDVVREALLKLESAL